MRWDAKLYDSVVSPQTDAGRRLVEMAKVGAEENILDLGCGTGTLTCELASRAQWGTVMGLDPSPEMIEQTGQKLESFTNVNLVMKDARDMKFEGSFDLVFSSSVLQWIMDQENVLKRMHNALKPGGRVAIQIIEKDFFPELGRYAKEAISEIGAESFFEAGSPKWYMPTREEYEALLISCGFSGAEVSLWEQKYVFRSVNDVLTWLSSAGLRPFLARLPEHEPERFKYASAMRFENQRTLRGIEIVMRRLFAVAQKERVFSQPESIKVRQSHCC
jgi:trans-aconitate 2-methyltransferase